MTTNFKNESLFGIVFLMFIFLAPFSIHADQCIRPTPPTCYNTVPTYSSTGTQSNGSIVLPNGQSIIPGQGIVQNSTKQVQVSCLGTQKEIDYEAQKLSYEICSQTKSLFSSPSNNQSYCFTPITKDCDANILGNLEGLANLHGMGGADSANGVSACKIAHTDYLSELTTYNTCLSSNTSTQQQNIQNLQQQKINSVQQTGDSFCQRDYGTYPHYDQTKNGCVCQTGYWMNTKDAQCERPASICLKTLGPDSLVTSDSCVCKDNYIIDKTTGFCTDNRSTKTINQKVTDWLNSNGSCHNPDFTSDEQSQCVIYQIHPDTFKWQIIPVTSPQSQIQSTLISSSPEPQVQHSTMIVNNPVIIKTLKKPLTISAIAPTSTSPLATSTLSTTSSVVHQNPTIKAQKHWYQWFNPFFWFK